MNYYHSHQRDENDSESVRTEDSEDFNSDIESQLYSAVYHNDLSLPLTPEVEALYSINYTDPEGIIVSLKENTTEKNFLEHSVNNVIKEREQKHFVNSNAEKIQTTESILTGNDIVEDGSKFQNVLSKENLPDWKSNCNLDYIPIGNKIKNKKPFENIKYNIKKDFETILDKILQMYPRICVEKLRTLLHQIAKRKKKVYLKDIVKQNKKFLINTEKKHFFQPETEKDVKYITTTTQPNNVSSESNSIKEKFKKPSLNMVESKENAGDEKSFEDYLIKQNEPLITNIICNSNKDNNCSPSVIIIESSEDESFNNLKGHRPTSLSNLHKKRKSQIFKHPTKWTKEMVEFYDKESKKLSEFNHEIIKFNLRRQKFHYKDWICSQYDYKRGRNRSKYMQCSNCWQFGHNAFSCHQRNRTPICHMCGNVGHNFNSCNQKKCLNCGDLKNSFCEMCEKCTYFICHKKNCCDICGSTNHPKELCTDLWRCYHSTTNNNGIIEYKTQTPNIRKSCSYCSKTGHFAHECILDNFKRQTNSSFVTNFNPTEKLADYREMVLTVDLYKKLLSPKGEEFLQFLSNYFNTKVDITSNEYYNSLRCFGTPEQLQEFKNRVIEWNTNNLSRKERKTRKRLLKSKQQRKRKKNRLNNIDDFIFPANKS